MLNTSMSVQDSVMFLLLYLMSHFIYIPVYVVNVILQIDD